MSASPSLSLSLSLSLFQSEMQWTVEREACLLTLLERYPMVGVHRHINLVSLTSRLQQLFQLPSPSAAIAMAIASALSGSGSSSHSLSLSASSSSGLYLSSSSLASSAASLSNSMSGFNAASPTVNQGGTSEIESSVGEYSPYLAPTIRDVQLKLQELYDLTSLVCVDAMCTSTRCYRGRATHEDWSSECRTYKTSSICRRRTSICPWD